MTNRILRRREHFCRTVSVATKRYLTTQREHTSCRTASMKMKRYLLRPREHTFYRTASMANRILRRERILFARQRQWQRKDDPHAEESILVAEACQWQRNDDPHARESILFAGPRQWQPAAEYAPRKHTFCGTVTMARKILRRREHTFASMATTS